MFKMKTLLIAILMFPALMSATELEQRFNETVITINDHNINAAQLNQFAQEKINRRFYHGKPPENEQKSFMLEMADELVDQYLLAHEAKRLKLAVDQDKIDKILANYQETNKDKPNWSQAKTLYLPMHQQQLTEKQLVKTLQQHVNENAMQTPEQVKKFYQQHPEKFTQPAQIRASIILLPVSPNAGSFVWKAAAEQALSIVKKLDDGGDFATLAELHSLDITADQGGDMGFLHEGMAAARAEEAMKLLTIGLYSQPVMLLEGIAIFKLTDRKDPIFHPFNKVATRAAQLANKDAKDTAWASLKATLRDQSTINIDQSKLLFM